MPDCKALLDRIAALQQNRDERLQPANAYEIARLQALHRGCLAQPAQFVSMLMGTVAMITSHPDFNTPATVDMALKLPFNDDHTAVSAPYPMQFFDSRGRTKCLLKGTHDTGPFDKKSGRMILTGLMFHVDFIGGAGASSGLKSMVLSTDAENELGRGSRMDRTGSVRLAGRGTFEHGRWLKNTFALLIAGTVTPVP